MNTTIIIGTDDSKDELEKLIDNFFPKEGKNIIVTNSVGGILTNVLKAKNSVIVLLDHICLGSPFAVITQIKGRKENAKVFQYSDNPVKDPNKRFDGIVIKNEIELLGFLKLSIES